MVPEILHRKLTAILSADVKGYSRLMGEDETGTVRTLTAYRELMSNLISKHRGRIVDSPGDNLLAEFGSVVDAVQCAAEIQRELRGRNAELPENRRMEFRIGINLGDVIEEGDRIYGDGVNIAARVESLAEGGGTCISGTVFDQVENKLALEWEYLGEQAVKNIKKPLRIYRVRMPDEEAPGDVGGNLKLLDKPSIAVLPFVNISGDPEQEYFGDGITEDLITDLCKISGLFVIARHSVFTYKGKAVKVDQVGRELGVRHVLEGSVRKAGNRVRITAQLVDARTGGHLWAERYDREQKDIFDLQDEVTQKIVSTLAVKLTKGEEDRLAGRYTDNLEAYDYALRGSEYYSRFTKEASAQAREMFQKAIQLDPDYALAYSRLGLTYLHEWTHGWSQDPQLLGRAFELAQKAIALDDTLPEAHRVLGDVYLWRKQHEEAIAELEKAISLNPNYADAIAGLGDVLNHAGNPEEAIRLVKRATRLNPHHHAWYFYVLGLSYISTERYEKAVEILKRGLIRNPDFMIIHLLLAGIYAEANRMEEARVEVEEVLRITPDFSLEVFKEKAPFKDQARLDRFAEALRKAGWR
jgi:adenylate cyclase